MAGSRSEGEASTAPARQGLVLAALILVASVANLNLAVANTALPDIGKAFDASQTALDLIAVGYSLGLAASVLYLGALGDRYGRKLMLVLGTFLAIPASILAATASSVGVLIGARIVGGLAAGMAYPTTLALITALWSGRSERVQQVATEGDLHWLVTNGSMKYGMPSWAKLGDPQIWQVITYVRSLGVDPPR